MVKEEKKIIKFLDFIRIKNKKWELDILETLKILSLIEEFEKENINNVLLWK